MEFGPIFRALKRNKTRFLLISLEVALTLAIAVNCINMVVELQRQMTRPVGFDQDNLVSVLIQPFAEALKDPVNLDQSRIEDVKLMRSLPGVVSAEAISAIPLSGSGSSTGFKPLGSEMHTISSGYFQTGHTIVQTLGVTLSRGRDLNESDIPSREEEESDGSRNVLITQAYADVLFPDGDAVGQQIQGRNPENPHTIVGIVEHMQGAWPKWDKVNNVTLIPSRPGSFNWGQRFLVRTREGHLEEVAASLERELLARDDGRNATILTLPEVKANTYKSDRAVITLLGIVIALLVFVTCLGIVGITSFSVAERTREIGTRRALGASRPAILRHFLTENWLMTSLGLALGLLLSYGLNYLLVNFINGTKLDWQLVVAAMLVTWLAGLASAFLPALRGARVAPAVASRH